MAQRQVIFLSRSCIESGPTAPFSSFAPHMNELGFHAWPSTSPAPYTLNTRPSCPYMAQPSFASNLSHTGISFLARQRHLHRTTAVSSPNLQAPYLHGASLPARPSQLPCSPLAPSPIRSASAADYVCTRRTLALVSSYTSYLHIS